MRKMHGYKLLFAEPFATGMSILHCTSRCERRATQRAPASETAIRRISVFITHLVARIRTFMRYRASVRALSELNDRELADIGISRANIREAASRAVIAA
jgi:uncharacterized protein YjiS (DUF1127 family)